MTDRADVEAIRASSDLVALIRATVPLKRRGSEFWGACPFHAESTPSLHVRPEHGYYHCFGCGAGGDVFDWLQQAEGLTFKEAVERLKGQPVAKRANGHKNGHAVAKLAPKPVPAVLMPVPADAPPPTFDHPRHGTPSLSWDYRDAEGRLLGYIVRFDTEGGGKEVLPRVYTAQGWRWQGFPKPRPLYGLDALAARPDAPVLVVEGEKSAEAARLLVPSHVVVTWCGGTQAVAYADWSPLKGRAVLIWPDCDQPGEKAAAEIRGLVEGSKVVHPPEGWPKGHDAADLLAEGWTPERVADWWIAKRVGEPHVMRAPQHADPPPPASAEPEPDAPLPLLDEDQWPFSFLGHFEGSYYYVPHDGGTVVKIAGAGHTKQALVMLAQPSWWEMTFGCKGKDNWDTAANALIRMSHKFGIYDPWRFRGRGAWLDKGRVVIHLGNRLLVDGVEMPPDKIESEFFYGRGRTLKFAESEPVGSREAGKLLEICKLLNWENKISAYLLAGAIALAPICGALDWRPHVWIVAPAGAGKTTIAETIIAPCVGSMMVNCAAKTTEPGVRRRLSCDAFPVMLDEFEANDQTEQVRCKAMMGLARSASRETSAEILQGGQGGAGGDSQSFRVRSMFFFLSIGLSAKDYADLTRISILSLKAPQQTPSSIERFHTLQDMVRETLTERWVNGLHARMVDLIPTIRHNAEVFALAGAKTMGTRRLGDQIGALLAGAFALTSTKQITPEAAAAWIEQQDWQEEQEILQDVDGINCLARILEHKVPVDSTRGTVRRSLGELADLAMKPGVYDDYIPRDVAKATMKRYGLSAVDAEYLAISNTHSAVADILKGTPWQVNWARRLKLINGAMTAPETIYFSGGKTRAMMVPVG